MKRMILILAALIGVAPLYGNASTQVPSVGSILGTAFKDIVYYYPTQVFGTLCGTAIATYAGYKFYNWRKDKQQLENEKLARKLKMHQAIIAAALHKKEITTQEIFNFLMLLNDYYNLRKPVNDLIQEYIQDSSLIGRTFNKPELIKELEKFQELRKDDLEIQLALKKVIEHLNKSNANLQRIAQLSPTN